MSGAIKGLVLSAGRTSTVFLTSRLIELYPDLHVAHEPAGSRLDYLRANMNHYLGMDNTAVAAKFNDRFRSELETHGNYIELNPFLCPLCADLHSYVSDLDIVHLIRHPATWVPSLIQHGASGAFSHFIRLIPFHTPVVNRSLKQHLNLSYLQRIMWRWAEYNQNIASLRNIARSYTLIHFEDLFDQSKKVSESAMQKLLQGFGLPVTRLSEMPDNIIPKNTSRSDNSLRYTNWSKSDKAYLKDELSSILHNFSYRPDGGTE